LGHDLAYSIDFEFAHLARATSTCKMLGEVRDPKEDPRSCVLNPRDMSFGTSIQVRVPLFSASKVYANARYRPGPSQNISISTLVHPLIIYTTKLP
jgi:hypothetical protein